MALAKLGLVDLVGRGRTWLWQDNNPVEVPPSMQGSSLLCQALQSACVGITPKVELHVVVVEEGVATN